MTDNTALAQELEALYLAAKGCEFDLRPSDGPIAKLVLFMHGNGNAILAALRTPAPAPVGGDVVERVAKAIHEARMVHVEHEERWDWDQAHKPYYHDLARAALAAMPPSAQEGSHERA